MRLFLLLILSLTFQLHAQASLPAEAVKEINPVVHSASPSKHVSYSPDGRMIAVCTPDMVEIRDAQTLSMVREIKPAFRSQSAQAQPSATAWSPDGMAIAIAGSGLELREAKTGELIRILDQDLMQTQSLTFSRDGSYLAVVRCQSCAPSTLRVWQLPAGNSVTSRFPNQDKIQGVSFSRDQKLVVTYTSARHSSSGSEYKLRLASYDVETGKVEADFPIRGGFASAPLVLSDDGNTVLTVIDDFVQAWDLRTQKEIRSRTFSTLQIAWMVPWIQAGKVAMVGVEGWKKAGPNTRKSYETDPRKTSPLVVWDYVSDDVKEFKDFPVMAWKGVAVSPEMSSLMLVGDVGLCRVSLSTGERFIRTVPQGMPTASINPENWFSLWGDKFSALVRIGQYDPSRNGTFDTYQVIRWDFGSSEAPVIVPYDQKRQLRIVTQDRSYSIDEDRNVYRRTLDGELTKEPSLGLWGKKGAKAFTPYLIRQGDWLAGSVGVSAWEKAGDKAWESQGGNRVGLLNTKTKVYTEIPERPGEPITDLRFSGNSRYLAIGYGPGMRVIACPGPPSSPPTFPDPKNELDPTLNSSVLIWDLKESRQKYLFKNAVQDNTNLAISPDSCLVASVGMNDYSDQFTTLFLWSLESGDKVASWKMPGWKHKLFFDKSGEYLIASTMHDGFKIVRIKDRTICKEWKDPDGSTDWVSLHESGRFLVTVNRRGHFRVWDVPSGSLKLTIRNLTPPNAKAPEWIAYTPDGKFDGSEGIESQVSWNVDGSRVDGRTWAIGHKAIGLLQSLLQQAK